MAITIRIDGDDYLVSEGTLQISLQAGLGGSQLQFGLVPGQGYPPLQKKVTLNLAGIDFEGLLIDDGRQSANTHIGDRSYTAIGQQFLLDRDINVEFRGLTSVANILDELLFDTGVPGTIIGETREVRGFAFKGPLKSALQTLGVRGRYMLYLAPDGVQLIDRDDPPAAPIAWSYGITSGWRNFNPQKSNERPFNRIVIEGGVPKRSDSDSDEEEIEVSYAGDGIRKRFGYPRTTDEIFDVTVDGTSKTICKEGDPEQASFDAFNDRGNYDVVFATAPAASTEVILSCRIQRARGIWNNTTSQSAYAADFGGDGVIEYKESRPEIRTQLEADEYAENLAVILGVDQKQASAEVWAQEGIFHPGRKVVQTWTAENWNETLPVQQSNLAYKSDLAGWLQQVSTSNGRDGDVSGSATGYSGFGRGSGNQITEKLPPTETSTETEKDFTLTLTPESQNVTDGTTEEAVFTVEATAVNGYTGNITLSKTGLAGTTAVWEPDNEITGGSGTRTLKLTATAGNWTDGATGEEGMFGVTGVGGIHTHTANGEVVIDPEPECASLTYELRTSNHQISPDPSDYDGLLCYGSGAPELEDDWERDMSG
ncbi:MAG TPA: hypothetical protein PLB32_25700, partial [Acidobacteriota bacterium]|nr:hypothetical protein [Acidobacteriota bacterium]